MAGAISILVFAFSIRRFPSSLDSEKRICCTSCIIFVFFFSGCYFSFVIWVLSFRLLFFARDFFWGGIGCVDLN